MTRHTPNTSRFVDFAHDLTVPRIPDATLQSAKLAILDWIGVTLAGSTEPLADALIATQANCPGGSTVVGRALTTTPEAAALINGACAHALDFDDYLAEGVIHGSASLVGGLLAVAEERALGGEALLNAFVAGYEAHAHLSTLLGHPLIHQGFHPTGVLTHVGTALGVGKLMGLSRQALTMCVGMSAAQAAGLLASFGTMSKPLHTGKAATDGVLSAKLAEAGYTASDCVLDGERGFPAVMAGVDPALELGLDLGRRWLVDDNAIKPYAACGAIHAAIDAALELAPGIHPQQINRVTCEVSGVTVHVAGNPDPDSGLEAKFSTQYAVATSLLHSGCLASDFTDTGVQRGDVKALTARVELIESYERITEARVEVVLADGTSLGHKVEWAKGSPENPMSRDNVVDKFLGLAAPIIGSSAASEAVKFVDTLEQQTDMRLLTGLLRAP